MVLLRSPKGDISEIDDIDVDGDDIVDDDLTSQMRVWCHRVRAGTSHRLPQWRIVPLTLFALLQHSAQHSLLAMVLMLCSTLHTAITTVLRRNKEKRCKLSHRGSLCGGGALVERWRNQIRELTRIHRALSYNSGRHHVICLWPPHLNDITHNPSGKRVQKQKHNTVHCACEVCLMLARYDNHDVDDHEDVWVAIQQRLEQPLPPDARMHRRVWIHLVTSSVSRSSGKYCL